MERHRLVKRPATGVLGRPRSEAAHQRILSAAVAWVREVGFDLVTMEGIAARARVGKATVYRRWSSKETLVAEAIGQIVRAIPAPDTGSTEGDLFGLMRTLLGMYSDPATGPLLSGLVAAMARNAGIACAVRNGMVAIWREAVREVLARAVARGDLRNDLDVELVMDLLSGPLFHRFLMTGKPLDESLVRGVVAVVLRGFTPGKRKKN